MGLFQRAAKILPEQFSIFQMMATLGMQEEDHHEARNILKQWYLLGLVKRLSDNMYMRVPQDKVEPVAKPVKAAPKKAKAKAAPKKGKKVKAEGEVAPEEEEDTW
jgi:hypothetical protein